MRGEERKYRVLFVDDDEGVLRGLRRSLRKKRNEWDMRFACGGNEALNFLEDERADVVVSDMQMPEMDGAELLEAIRKKHPHTNRLILSGYTKEESIIKTVGPAHFYLAKPCSTEEITTAVDRLLTLNAYVSDESLRSFSTSIKKLPSVPSVVRELMIELEKEPPSLDLLSDIIGKDIALTAQVLRLTNSAFFSLPTKATNPRQAVKLLGVDTIRDVIFSAGIIGVFQGTKDDAFRLERLSKNCLLIGKLAKRICKHWGLPEEECGQASCAGNISHLGTLLLQTADIDKYHTAMERLGQDVRYVTEAEKLAFNTSHQKLGAYMLGVWGFAIPIVEAVAFHHLPPHYLLEQKSPTLAVYIAQTLCKGENWENDKRQSLKSSIDWKRINHLVDETEFDIWLNLMDEITK